MMEQTPVHEIHNAELLELMPKDLASVVEVGCSSGALAREYKVLNPHCRYVGVEIEPKFAALARRHCDEVRQMDIETVTEQGMRETLCGQCWVFGDSLEHLRDPWALLGKIRRTIPESGSVVACIPNAQHWSVQARLASGNFRYETAGLLDRTHLRWFTRQTVVEMFEGAGFRIVAGVPRIFPHPNRDRVIAGIRMLAQCVGMDPNVAANDALATQYVLRAVPD